MKVTVKKYDPTTDDAPYYKEYEVPETEYMTVLEALVYIDENEEPLAFDYSCRGRACGRCSMMVNGEACCACTTATKGRDITVEPLSGHPVIRDLVVNKKDAQDKLSRLYQRVRAEDLAAEIVHAPIEYDAIYEQIDGLERCARCTCCQAACPVATMYPDTYCGPSAMVAIALRHYDPYDEGDRVAQAVQNGLWNCIMCGKCDEVCPCDDIHHVETWQKLRDEATRRNLTSKKIAVSPWSKGN